MSILIKGMEMPADDMKNIMILSDGRVFQFSGYGNPKPLGTAIPVPDHGRLVDADEVKRIVQEHDYLLRDPILNSTDRGMWTIGVFQAVDEAPTFIPASREEEDS